MTTQVYLFVITGRSDVFLHSTLPQGSVSSVILWPHRWWMNSLR